MDLNKNQSLEFKESVRRFLPQKACQSWLNSLQLLKITPSKVIMCGIQHEIYRYEIKTNHEALLKKVLDELFPEKAPFSEKKFEYKIGFFTSDKKSVQPEFDLDQEKVTIKIGEQELKETIPVRQSENAVGRFSSNLLDTYIPGKRNLLAYRASKAVVDMPGFAFNPFVIYGESGAGKTHLLDGINNELQQNNPNKNTVQVSAEDFLNDFINHLRTSKMKEFRDRYRKVDALLLDDLQALLPSSKCQAELLYTINALRKKKAQIVIASQEAPTLISKLNSGLRGRLESGLTVDIGIPDDKTRIAILENKAKESGVPLNDELAEFIVKHIKGGIRRMEGVLMRLGVHASLLNEELTVDLAQSALKDWIENPIQTSKSLELEQEQFTDETEKKILQRICVMFQISKEDLHSYRRDRKHIKARQSAVYLLKQLTSFSLSEIGIIVGRNHSTVHATLKKVKERMSKDVFFQKQMQTFLQEFEKKSFPSNTLVKNRNYPY